jgi:succinate dehydrogenase / fumarate reductase cytochrome b subunit
MKNNILDNNYSIVGKKIFLGFSGLVLLGFIVGHLLGNMTFFLGADSLNNYAYFLHNNKGLVYSARVFLIVNLFIHLYFSISITNTNMKAKQIGYIVNKNLRATFASKTMIYSGALILVFLVYHLCHFTLGWIDSSAYGLHDSKNRIDVYGMVHHSFSNSFISLFYLFSLMCLGLHLSHAFFSVCQTFSIINKDATIAKAQKAGRFISCVIVSCYAMIPLSVFLKIV